MSLYKNCGWWKNCDGVFEFSVKSYVTNTINLSCAKILLPSDYSSRRNTYIICVGCVKPLFDLRLQRFWNQEASCCRPNAWHNRRRTENRRLLYHNRLNNLIFDTEGGKNVYMLRQFNSRSDPVKGKFAYLCINGCCRLRSTLLVKL